MLISKSSIIRPVIKEREEIKVEQNEMDKILSMDFLKQAITNPEDRIMDQDQRVTRIDNEDNFKKALKK